MLCSAVSPEAKEIALNDHILAEERKKGLLNSSLKGAVDLTKAPKL